MRSGLSRSEQVTGDQHYNGSFSYGLDPVGNRLSASSSLHGVNSGSFNYNADDELSGELYEANGNVTASGGKTFGYDSQNRLTSMNGTAVQIKYDGDGNRVAKTANGTTTQYLVDDLNPTGYPQVVEEIVNGAPQREYTYGLQRIDEDQVIQGAWVPSFYGYDGFGTVRQLTNTAGAVTDTWEYDAFGNVISSTGTTPNEMLYRGEQYDSDLGLCYLRARYYNPLTGRFMSRDPEDGRTNAPATLHKYLYAAGDPVDDMDPTGRMALAEASMQDFTNALKDAAAVYTVGVTVACELNITAAVLHLAADPSIDKRTITPEVENCSATGKEDRCSENEAKIQAIMAELESRYNEMLEDYWDLYRYRPGPNPANPEAGTWPGHQYWYFRVRGELQDAVDQAVEDGCPVPPEAYTWLATPPPARPAPGRD